ncbi:LANO_0F12332g1_1 [Lachancea nothofagi CBS 11611]|uniref:LANO_0F12332g1_1 n=1 Tax=Lachancea nothofagi CBS 11611 TaxID=1266666 RepID=A0A1G4KB95_9SACH|nr:LANO_0F12332g1_1 [Lachancea nothofagi CBS 11611]
MPTITIEPENSSKEPSEICVDEASDVGSKTERFSERRKKFIVAISSAACFLTPMAGLAFLPAISTIAERFNTTASTINVSNAVYNVCMGLSCFWAPFSDSYGRKPAFLICMFFCVVSTVLVACSQNLAMFFVFRATTALFGTAFFSIGAQIIGDIYPPEKRGSAMGWNIAGSQIGPPLGPTFGAIIVTYTSWRIIFYILAILGGLVLVLAFFFLPETLPDNRHSLALSEYNNSDEVVKNPQKKKRFLFIPFNIMRPIISFKYPSLILAGISSMALMYNMYSLLTPIRYVVDPRFDITLPIYGGLFYLAPGIGYLLGSFMGGKLSDYQVKKSIKQRGRRVPEDRLRMTLLFFGFLSPASVIAYGWSIQSRKGGYALPIISMFINGLSQTSIFPTINSYCIDSMASEIGGGAVGGNYMIRFFASAVGSATCLKAITSIGIGWTSTISAGVLVIGSISMLLLVLYGEQLREGKKVIK